jgi:CMP-N-acetylneuraminic acid synthetase
MRPDPRQHEAPEVLALIPARGGSRGLPGKHLLPLAGKPLIVHTIEQARTSRRVTRVLVTTDDAAIAAAARAAGAEAPFLRPAELATDTAPIVPALQHALRWLEAEEGYRPAVVVYLQVTNPLRQPGDIDAAVEQLLATDADTVVSLCRVEREHPFYLRRMEGDRVSFFLPDMAPSAYVTRQALPPVYRVNGAIIAVWRRVLMEEGAFYGADTRGTVMPAERAVDIDSWVDFRLAELLLEAGRSREE